MGKPRVAKVESATVLDIEEMILVSKPRDAQLLTGILGIDPAVLTNQCSSLWSDDGQILAFAGVVRGLDAGSLQAFLFLSPAASGHRIAMMRWAHECMKVVAERFSPRRLEIHVATGDPRYRDFAEVLGFLGEGIARSYAEPGVDHERMAKVWA